MNPSPFLAIKRLEVAVNRALSALDIFELPAPERTVVVKLKDELIDARLDIRDYELSETRDEQLKNARQGKKRLEQIRKLILNASEYDVFSAVDVAQLTAQLEQISENVR